MSEPERSPQRTDWRRIGVVATVLFVPGGFLLGAALAARRMRAAAGTDRSLLEAAAEPCVASEKGDAAQLPLWHVRRDLIAHLYALKAENPRTLWRLDLEKGLAAGVEEIVHFFFDDHGPFDEADIGKVFLDREEMLVVQALRASLRAVLDTVGAAEDDAFVDHPLWLLVRQSASTAYEQIAA